MTSREAHSRAVAAAVSWKSLSLFVMVLCLSLAGNLWFALKVRGEHGTPKKRESLVGTKVPAITATTRDHRREVIDYAGNMPTVLYIFEQSCGWCTRNLKNINALVQHSGERYRFVGLALSPEGPYNFSSASKLGFPVYTDLSNRVRRALRIGPTPHTVVVSTEGVVIHDWVGAYSGQMQGDVEHFFGVSLPGLD